VIPAVNHLNTPEMVSPLKYKLFEELELFYLQTLRQQHIEYLIYQTLRRIFNYAIETGRATSYATRISSNGWQPMALHQTTIVYTMDCAKYPQTKVSAYGDPENPF
jgi:hypothetical protein